MSNGCGFLASEKSLIPDSKKASGNYDTVSDPIIRDQGRNIRDAVKGEDSVDVRMQENFLAVLLKSDDTFESGSYGISRRMETAISQIADVINRYPDTRLIVEGHTDNEGMESVNLKLSEKRADAVKKMLVRYGVDKLRIEVLALGGSAPAAPNHTGEGRGKNRRIEIKIIPVK